jgi:ABC-type lipoprotein release transport system permease subunit
LMSDTLHLAVGVGQLAMAVALFSTITAAAAFLPAFRAAHLQPVTAIQSAT